MLPNAVQLQPQTQFSTRGYRATSGQHHAQGWKPLLGSMRDVNSRGRPTYDTPKGKVLWLLFGWSCHNQPVGMKRKPPLLCSGMMKSCFSSTCTGYMLSRLLYKAILQFPLGLQHQEGAKGLPFPAVCGPQLCLEGIGSDRVWQWGWGWCLQDNYPLGLIESSLKDFPWCLQVIFSTALVGKFGSSPRVSKGLQHKSLIICFTGQDQGTASKTSDLKSQFVENRV